MTTTTAYTAGPALTESQVSASEQRFQFARDPLIIDSSFASKATVTLGSAAIFGLDKPAEVAATTTPWGLGDTYERDLSYALRDASFRGFAGASDF